jgi:paraquat-inducible protein B
VRLKKEAQSFTAADSRFWVVRTRISGLQVSGLATLVLGAYIGADAGISTEETNKFVGLETPPIITRGAFGKQYFLHAADNGSLDIGSSVYFRRIKVGQVTAYDLDENGKDIIMRIFINSPYDRFVGINTRFWHASGFDVQLNADGLKIRSQSLDTVLFGGLSFQSPDDNPGALAKEDTAFILAENQTEALKEPDGDAQIILLDFKQSLRGLRPGAEVSFRGLVLGQVKSIGIDYDPRLREFTMPVLVQVYPERLGRRYAQFRKEPTYTAQQRLQFMIDRGLRAQLRSADLLTGQLYVAFDFFPNVVTKKGDVSKRKADVAASQGLLAIPTIPNTAEETQTQISEIARKLNKVPFDQIGSELQESLKTLQRTLNSAGQLTETLNNDVAPEIAVAMKDVHETLNAAGRTLSEEAPLQQDLRQTLQELSRAAISLRVVTDYLERHPESIIRGKREDKQ